MEVTAVPTVIPGQFYFLHGGTDESTFICGPVWTADLAAYMRRFGGNAERVNREADAHSAAKRSMVAKSGADAAKWQRE